MPRLTLPDAVLAFDAEGSGRSLIFLHGVGNNRTAWREQLREFGRDYLAVAVDMRGYHESEGEAETVSMRRFALDVAALIEHFGAGAAHVCGLSMGGIVALNLWRERPDLVCSLILSDTWANHPEAAATHAERLAGIDAGSMPELARTRMPGAYAPAAGKELVERGIGTFASLRKDVYRAASADLWPQNLIEVAQTVTVPTLILVGEHDSVTPPVLSVELHWLIAGSRLVTIPQAGHISNEENPTAFNTALREFLVDLA